MDIPLFGVPTALMLGAFVVAEAPPLPPAKKPAPAAATSSRKPAPTTKAQPKPAETQPEDPPSFPLEKNESRTGTLRAGLIDDTPDDAGQPKVIPGEVAWSSETRDIPGRGPVPLVRAQISVPSAQIQVEVAVTRSADPSMTAPFLFEVTFAPGGLGTAPGGVVSIEALRTRRTGSHLGEALAGMVRRRSDTSFYVVPSSEKDLLDQSVKRLLSSPWIDIPLVHGGEHPLTITFEKGRAGREMLDVALKALVSPNNEQR